jgi:glyoxylase I family protein
MDRRLQQPVQGAEAVIHVRDIDHVVLRVADLERTLHFYLDMLGCRVERAREDLGLYHLRAGRSMIDILPISGKLGAMGGAGPAAEGRNVDHFCLRVEPFDVDTITACLRQHGVEPASVGMRFGAEGEGMSIYIADPDGNVVELKGPPAATSVESS